jgi:hypothetical protein
MPEETRRVLFSPDEIRVVVDEFIIKRFGVETGGEIGQIALRKIDAGVTAGFTRGGGATKHMQLDAPELLAAVMLFCQKRRIPLPRKATKFLQVSDDKLALTITIARVN